MKILVLLPIYPWPLNAGWAQRFHFIADFLARNHEVSLLAHHTADESLVRASPLENRCAFVMVHEEKKEQVSSCRFTRLWSKFSATFSFTPKSLLARRSDQLIGELRALRARANFDCVWAARTWMAEMAHEAGFGRIIVDIDDIPSVVVRRRMNTSRAKLRRVFDYLEFVRLSRYERKLSERFWKVVVSKPEDLPEYTSARAKTFVVPNGIVSVPEVSPGTEADCEMLFVGHLFHDPNVDAIRFFVEQILPRIREALPQAKLVIVGAGRNDEIIALAGRSHCRVAVAVENLEPVYAQASIVVVPVRQGSGTRLKLLEALVRGKCVVATSIGAEGLDLRPGVDLQIADTPDAFALACIEMLCAAERRREMGSVGRARVLSRFAWPVVEPAIHAALLA